MALTPGARIGPYEITAQIGVGGMGEVYRATDKNLKRQVAIKVLPDAVASTLNDWPAAGHLHKGRLVQRQVRPRLMNGMARARRAS